MQHYLFQSITENSFIEKFQVQQIAHNFNLINEGRSFFLCEHNLI